MESPRKSLTPGFTLVELLVVIAIIAILAAIIFPVFATARAKARQTVCMNNQKQMVAGMILYRQDYDERWIDSFPNHNENADQPDYDTGPPLYLKILPYWYAPRNFPGFQKDYLLKPYIKNDAIQYCPTLHKVENGSLMPNYAINELDSITVDFSGHLPPDLGVSGRGWMWRYVGPFGRQDALLTHPSSLMVMWEHNSVAIECNIWPTVSGGNGTGKPTQTTISEGGFIDSHWDAAHFNGLNAAFADGHVKRWSLGQMSNQLVCYWDLPPAP